MPTYQYACTSCGERLEVVQKFTDDPLTVCPACSGALRKVFSAVGVVFKGSGFYKTDSRRSASAGSAGSSGSAGGKDGSGSTTDSPKPAEGAKPAAAESGTGSSGTGSSGGSGAGGSGSGGSSSGGSGAGSSGSGDRVA